MLPLPGLHVTEDGTNQPVIAISAKGHSITDSTVDESQINAVSPDYYGLSEEQVAFHRKLNRALDDAAEAAVNAGAGAIQEALGIRTGDVASHHFFGVEAYAPFRTALGKYIIAEVNIATKE
jgi:hypothetical protein